MFLLVVSYTTIHPVNDRMYVDRYILAPVDYIVGVGLSLGLLG